MPHEQQSSPTTRRGSPSSHSASSHPTSLHAVSMHVQHSLPICRFGVPSSHTVASHCSLAHASWSICIITTPNNNYSPIETTEYNRTTTELRHWQQMAPSWNGAEPSSHGGQPARIHGAMGGGASSPATPHTHTRLAHKHANNLLLRDSSHHTDEIDTSWAGRAPLCYRPHTSFCQQNTLPHHLHNKTICICTNKKNEKMVKKNSKITIF